MNPPTERTGVVLTGGASRRMGTDKAFVEIDGRPMVLLVADALRAGGCTTIECQGGDDERLSALDLVVHGDDQIGEGPVPAIVQAIERHDGPVVIAATDLPGLDAVTVDALASEIEAGAAAAVATCDGPHLAVAIRGGATTAAACRASGATSFRRLIAALGAVPVPVPAEIVRNVNRPDDRA